MEDRAVRLKIGLFGALNGFEGALFAAGYLIVVVPVHKFV